MILKGFGFEEDTATNKMNLSNYDADLFAKGLELLRLEQMWKNSALFLKILKKKIKNFAKIEKKI